MLCVLFSFFVTLNCGASEAPEPTIAPTPSPTPTTQPSASPDTRKSSTDGKSLWEAKWEEMTGKEFVRDPLTPEEIAAKEDAAGEQEGRFIYIENRP